MYQLDPKKLSCLGIQDVPTTLMNIEVERLHPGVWQKRKLFSEESLDDLADSMKTTGTNVVPMIVCFRPDGDFSIIAGERRWRSGQRLGFRTLKCEVGAYSYEQAAYISAIENLQRTDLNPIEEATSYNDLCTELNLSHGDLATQLGKSRSHISNYVRLLDLDIRVRDSLISSRLSYGHARPLCSLKNKADQRNIAEKAVRFEWSVQKIQQAVNALTQRKPSPVKLSDTDPDLKRLERDISEVTGLDCVVKRTPGGSWQLGFLAPESESFTGLLDRLGVRFDSDLEN